MLVGGDEILITCDLSGTGDFDEMEAEVISLSASTVEVEVHSLPGGSFEGLTKTDDGWRVVIPENRVRKIARPSHGMRRLAGGLIGAGVGLGVGFAVDAACVAIDDCNTDGTDSDVMFAAFFACIGGGAAVGALLTGTTPGQTIYLSSGLTESSFRYSVVPIVSHRRKGALFRLTW